MSDHLSFNLFGRDGYINPTRWSHADSNEERFHLSFYDAEAGVFRKKQARTFDGGWRWFEPHGVDALTIYNVSLDPRAFWYLTKTDMVDTRLTPECLLYWAKSMVLVEHSFYESKNWLEDHIRALGRRAMIEIKREISGESSNGSHLRAVR